MFYFREENKDFFRAEKIIFFRSDLKISSSKWGRGLFQIGEQSLVRCVNGAFFYFREKRNFFILEFHIRKREGSLPCGWEKVIFFFNEKKIGEEMKIICLIEESRILYHR